MKTRIISLFCLIATIAQAQLNEEQNKLFQALSDELDRNSKELRLEGMEAPFFIGYNLNKTTSMSIIGNLGAIQGSFNPNLNTSLTGSVELLVGNYHRTNGLTNRYRKSYIESTFKLPIDCDYDEIRRNFWLGTDVAYKNSATQYIEKMTNWKQLNITSQEEIMDDFSKITPIQEIVPQTNVQNFNRHKYWTETVKNASQVFTEYPELKEGYVSLFITLKEDYKVTNEGTKIFKAKNFYNINISCSATTDDGLTMNGNLYIGEENEKDLPSEEKLIEEVRRLAKNLVALRCAPRIEENYDGPVLYTGQAAISLFKTFLQPNVGLMAFRPEMGGTDTGSMEGRMNRRVLPNSMNVYAMPTLKEYNGKKLLWSYTIDSEGVKPAESLTLVENGIVKNLMNGRIPSEKAPKSTGHNTGGGNYSINPGVIKFENKSGIPFEEMKAKLITMAKDEGLTYTYIVKGLPGFNELAYRVDVETGREELVRGIDIRDVPIRQLKKIAAMSNEEQVGEVANNSIICPNAILLEDVEITRNGQQTGEKAPIVKSPLAEKALKKTEKVKKKKDK